MNEPAEVFEQSKMQGYSGTNLPGVDKKLFAKASNWATLELPRDVGSFALTMDRNFEEMLQLRPLHSRIRLDFLVHEEYCWDLLCPLMAEAASRGIFSVRAVLDAEPQKAAFHAKIRPWLQAHGVDCVDLEPYNPDINSTDVLILPVPYTGSFSDHLHPYMLMLRGVRTALIPYCTEWLGGQHFHNLYFASTPIFWRVFTASAHSRSLYQQLLGLPEHMLPVMGNPEFDLLQSGDTEKMLHIQSLAKGRRIVLWAPHYSQGSSSQFNWGTWKHLGEGIAKLLAQWRKDIFVVLRPHPKLRASLEKDKHSGAAYILQQAGNVFLDMDGQSTDAVRVCDALIADCSSLLAKAMQMQKSVLFTLRKDGDGTPVLRELLTGRVHIAEDLRAVHNFLDMRVRGQDQLLPMDRAVRDILCGPCDGQAAVRFVEHLERYFFTPRKPA